MVTPSWAITVISMVFAPAAKAIGADAVLLTTVVPFTFNDDAVASNNAGVTVTDVVVPGTLEVYAKVLKLNAGDNVAVFTVRLDR